jgi:hypothetical protein
MRRSSSTPSFGSGKFHRPPSANAATNQLATTPDSATSHNHSHPQHQHYKNKQQPQQHYWWWHADPHQKRAAVSSSTTDGQMSPTMSPTKKMRTASENGSLAVAERIASGAALAALTGLAIMSYDTCGRCYGSLFGCGADASTDVLATTVNAEQGMGMVIAVAAPLTHMEACSAFLPASSTDVEVTMAACLATPTEVPSPVSAWTMAGAAISLDDAAAAEEGGEGDGRDKDERRRRNDRLR